MRQSWANERKFGRKKKDPDSSAVLSFSSMKKAGEMQLATAALQLKRRERDLAGSGWGEISALSSCDKKKLFREIYFALNLAGSSCISSWNELNGRAATSWPVPPEAVVGRFRGVRWLH